MPDVLRLVALFGIVLVNVEFMAFPTGASMVQPAFQTGVDGVAHMLVTGLLTFKTYGLFSFMFGVSLGFFLRSVERRGLRAGQLYRNRLLGLLLLGLLHGVFFFSGDILVIYALMGALLFGMRNWPVRRLVWVGVTLLLVQTLLASAAFLAVPGTPVAELAFEQQVMTEGTWGEVAFYRAISFAIILPIFLVLQGVSALGWFCLGLAAIRQRLIDQPDHVVWRIARRFVLVPSLILSFVASAMWHWGDGAQGMVLTVLSAPAVTFGYLGLIAWLSMRWQIAVGAGASSLSIYLGQSLVLSTIFAPYGFGLWGAVSFVTALGISVAITMALMLALSLWQKRFRHGPFEWVLRRITYGPQVA